MKIQGDLLCLALISNLEQTINWIIIKLKAHETWHQLFLPKITPFNCISFLTHALSISRNINCRLAVFRSILVLRQYYKEYSHKGRCEGVKSLSRVWFFETPWTVAYQAPPSMGFSRQEYWSGLPFPSPEVFPTQGSNPGLPHSRQML